MKAAGIRGAIVNAFLCGAALFITLVSAEVLLRRLDLFPDGARAFFFTAPPWQETGGGGMAYRPDSSFGVWAVHGGRVEFAVTFETNNLGFIDTIDYRGGPVSPGERRFVFAGDSFTAGFHGGNPWVPALRGRLPGTGTGEGVYNFGVGGTGLVNVLDLLRQFDGRLHFTDIVLAPISSDFFRLRWRPLTSGGEVRLCPEGEEDERCLARDPAGYLVGSDSSESEILRLFREIKGGGEKVRIVAALKGLLNSSGRKTGGETGKGVGRTAEGRRRSGNREALRASWEESFEALQEVKNLFGDRRIYLFHIPQKSEVRSGSYQASPRRSVESLGIVYVPLLEACRWSPDMFFERNNHPNALGYENIGRCVEELFSGKR